MWNLTQTNTVIILMTELLETAYQVFRLILYERRMNAR